MKNIILLQSVLSWKIKFALLEEYVGHPPSYVLGEIAVCYSVSWFTYISLEMLQVNGADQHPPSDQ